LAWGDAACAAFVGWYASCGAHCSQSPQGGVVFATLWGTTGAVSLAFRFATHVALRARTLAGDG
jgi:hypothetical protein